MARDHGGNADEAQARFGGLAADWIDLSTGINRVPYPLPPLPPAVWTGLPTRTAMGNLLTAAQECFGTTAPVVALAGAQAAIQLIPRLQAPGRAAVLGPTYNEHAAALRQAGWQVRDVADLTALAGADLAVVVNPNNPDGRQFAPADLLALLPTVGRLVVDESFADPYPALSLAAQAGRPGLLILRSFGKFWGLAGVRLGFVLGSAPDVAALAAMAGPWPVTGPALEIGRLALRDREWQTATAARLKDEAPRLDALAAAAGWQTVGGTCLFRLYATPDAEAARDHLARHRLWSRIFPWHPHWLRLGMPGNGAEWQQLTRALTGSAAL